MKAVLRATVLENPLVPVRYKELLSPRQAQFLAYEGREAMYGGAAGGGKSVALLIAALQFADLPGYHALLLRRTFKMLEKPGALIELSKEWLGGKAEWNEQKHRWTFPAGSTLTFGHLEHEGNKYDYQGAAYHFVGYDELTQFSDPMYRYLFSRTRRRAGCGIPVRMRSASNPGGVGHDWVKRRFIDPKTRLPGAVFVPAKLADNRGLDRAEYLESLNELDPLTRQQLLDGDWDAVAGGRFKEEWFGSYRRDPHSPDFVDTSDGERFRWADQPRWQTCDPSASSSTAADYFVLSTWLLTPKAKVLWWGCERAQLETPEQVTTCQRSYRRHRPQFVAVEEVLNQRALAQLLRRSTDPVMVVRGVSPLGRDKLARAAGFINLAASGRVLLPEDNPLFPLDDVIGELVRFTGDPDRDAHDDIVDTGSYMAELLPSLEPSAGGSKGPGVFTQGQTRNQLGSRGPGVTGR